MKFCVNFCNIGCWYFFTINKILEKVILLFNVQSGIEDRQGEFTHQRERGHLYSDQKK